jgi:hypothetical protein
VAPSLRKVPKGRGREVAGYAVWKGEEECRMSETTDAERKQKWVDQMMVIRACMTGLIDDGPTPEALQLAKDLAKQLNEAVESYLNENARRGAWLSTQQKSNRDR